MTPAVFDLLRHVTRESFGGSVTRLADTCGVSVQLASKWLAEDERKRVNPSPASCARIATALGYDLDYLLELAGHKPPTPDRPPADPDLVMINAAWPRLDEGLRKAIKILVSAGGRLTTGYASV